MRTTLIFVALGLALGCGDDDGGSDAGTDTGGGVDASMDGGMDASTDAGEDADVDAGPPGANWRCLGDITWGAPAAATITYGIVALEGLTTDPVADVAVRACARDDDSCAAPVDTGTTAADGSVSLTLPTGTDGFDGYFELTKDGYRDAIVQLSQPATEDQTQPMRMTSDADFSLQAAALGATPNAERGHVLVGVRDCGGMDTPDAGGSVVLSRFGRDTETIQFYLIGGVPDTDATETDDSGVGGFFNAVPGRIGVRVNQSTDYVGGVNDLLIRADWLTTIVVGPSPDDGNWACLGSVAPWPTPTGATVSFTGRVIDALTQAPVEGVNYRVCAFDDPTCASPVASGTTDASGEGTASLPAGSEGFDGFVELTLTGYRDMIGFFNPPLARDVDPTSPLTLPVFSDAAITTFTNLARVTVDDTRGHAFIQIADCGGFNSTDKGAELTASTSDAMSTRFYVDGVVPDTMSMTSLVGGFSGFFNLPAGDTGSETATTFSANVMGTSVGSVDTFIRAGWVHQTILPPSP